MDKVAGRPIEARFFTQGGQVDEATFWAEVQRLAGAGARAQVTAEAEARQSSTSGRLAQEVRWRTTPKGEALCRRLREQEAAG
jgi:hypothetical protein